MSDERRHDAARAALEGRRRQWISAITEGDPDGFVAVVAEDAVWLPPGPVAVVGREEIRSWVAGPMAEFDYEYTVRVMSVRIAGDRAVERARFRTQATTRSGERAPTHEGTYTILWRRADDGAWVIERYVDHTGEGTPTAPDDPGGSAPSA